MDRRNFLKKVGIGGASIALGCAPVRVSRAAELRVSHPNLLIIHTDQLSSWAISAYAERLRRVPNYGKVLVETPHIDSLAADGALLENFFTNSAVCTPSRGCLLTGRYPHAHGAYRNNIEMNRDEVTLARVLQGQGYETGYAGKWHLDGPPKPGWLKPERSMGFADCRFMFNRGHWKKIEDRPGNDPKAHPYGVIGDETSFTTDWLAGKTIDFIRKARSRPFFYLVSFPDPHTPFTVREPYMSMYDPDDMIVPHTFKRAASVKGKASTEERLRRSKAHYCGQVKCIDDNVGRILNALRETPTTASTWASTVSTARINGIVRLTRFPSSFAGPSRSEAVPWSRSSSRTWTCSRRCSASWASRPVVVSRAETPPACSGAGTWSGTTRR